MASQIDRVAAELRQRVLSGRLPAGERVRELQFAAELGVSRTPLRIALGELEKQGLLERLPTRGYRVRRVSLHEVAMAIEVRGTLEGMAARLVAEAGAPAPTLARMKDCVQRGRALIDDALGGRRGTRAAAPLDTPRWAAMNAEFHEALAEGAGNPALQAALEHIGRTPMVRPGEMWMGHADEALTMGFVQRAQFAHEDVVRAIEAREGARAEHLLREHARRSADNKRALAAVTPVDAAGPLALPRTAG